MRKRKRSKILHTEEQMGDYCVQLIKKELEHKKEISIAFSGGETSIFLFKLLSKEKKLKWENINIFLVDERWIELDHEDSNFHSLKINLLDKIDIPEKNINKITFEETTEKSKIKYEKRLIDFFKDSIVFDLIFLGVGKDGHIASIFNLDYIQNNEYVLVTSSKDHPYERITLSMKVINKAKNKIVLLGHEKLKVVSNKEKKYPINHVDDPLYLTYR